MCPPKEMCESKTIMKNSPFLFISLHTDKCAVSAVLCKTLDTEPNTCTLGICESGDMYGYELSSKLLKYPRVQIYTLEFKYFLLFLQRLSMHETF